MEIQHGKGPWANPVSGIVPLGTTLTMVIGINDKQDEEKQEVFEEKVAVKLNWVTLLVTKRQ